MEHHSCRHCERIGPITIPDSMSLQHIDDIDLNDISHGIAEGCTFFKWVMAEFTEIHEQSLDVPHSSVAVLDEETRKVLPQDLKFCAKVGFIGSRRVALVQIGLWNTVENAPYYERDGLSLELAVSEDSSLSSGISTRPIKASPNTPESYELASSWISNCRHDHQQNPTNLPKFVPTRLLRISADNGDIDARIVHTKYDENYSYLALSYCWGGDQEHKTTQRRLQETDGCVNVASTPKTIRDAITVTINIGYHYLWVDSICIIQDDDHDKATEIGMMSSIFSHAVLTIAAFFPTNVREGFLQERKLHDIFELHTRHIGGEESSKAYAIPRPYYDPADALATRGWCFQERILSTRILEYRRHQIHFLCSMGCNFSDGWLLSGQKGRPSISDALVGYNTLDESQLHETWEKLVGNYTGLKLKFPEDRILAISGVAQRLDDLRSSGEKDLYLAGHWLSRLPEALLWYLWRFSLEEPEISFFVEEEFLFDELSKKRKPTWSWTSLDYRINYDKTGNCNAKQDFELVDYIYELQTPSARCGAVKDAILTVKGRVKSAWCYTASLGKGSGAISIQLRADIHGEQMAVVCLDALCPELKDVGGSKQVYVLEVHPPLNCTCLRLARGLILEEESRTGTRRRFSRLGVFIVFGPLDASGHLVRPEELIRFFGDCERDIVDLV
ncbi:heterokaryon incompatibility protein-domain-containing protein [Massariosphaeria phaeospora]|uniref:Heterokaryon incompatibility protein-domain-containing protein n=1 Tax=Massariosphaeria phaeospora TaxID=100035 RepID=A0A7C8M286_9PLEO|nr:heterokaryon incompatibility protein-domain-containing protein [Massariosphaeria phaeospora]